MAQTVSNRELRDIIFRNIKSPDDRKKLYQYLINIEGSGGDIEGWETVKKIFEPLTKIEFIDTIGLGLFNGEYTDDFINATNVIHQSILSGNKPYATLNANGEKVLAWTENIVSTDGISTEILFSRNGKTYRLKKGIGIVEEGYTNVLSLPNVEDANKELYRLLKNETHTDEVTGEVIVDRYAGYYIPTSDGWQAIYEIKNKYTHINKLANYAYQVEYDEIDYDGAEKYLEKHYTDYPIGGCSIAVKDGVVGGNFDWYLSNNSEFAIHTNKNGYRQEVFGIAGNIKGITDEIVDSKEYKKQFDYLPCLIESGMNSAGLVMKMNVVPAINNTLAVPTKHTHLGLHKVCGLMLVRMVLDKCATIEEALDYIQNKIDIYMPYNENFQQELHYLLTDGTRTYSIATENLQVIVTDITSHPIMTNFRLAGVRIADEADINTIEDYGMGVERFNLILSVYDYMQTNEIMNYLSNIKYSNMYAEDPDHLGLPLYKTEFTGKYDEGDDLTVTTPLELFERVFGIAKTRHDAADRDAENTWITTHSVVYNINTRDITICFQEQYGPGNKYRFKVSSEPIEEAPNDGKTYGRKNKVWAEMGAAGETIPIAYNDLVILRNNEKLIAGQKYRIIDYKTTTIQENTYSSENPFDVIVTAIDKSHLSEFAEAAHRNEDGYFVTNNLDAWKLKYCLDNDNERFEWADFPTEAYVTVVSAPGSKFYRDPSQDDTSFVYGICWKDSDRGYLLYTTNETPVSGERGKSNTPGDSPDLTILYSQHRSEGGKGVIYEMTDEFGNTCPYDFKNIGFKRAYDADTGIWSELSAVEPIYAYTFSDKADESATHFNDLSLEKGNNIRNNIIKPYYNNNKLSLNNICFFGTNIYNNKFDHNCYKNSFERITYNTFDVECAYNTLCKANHSNNVFGKQFQYNKITGTDNRNVFGNYCQHNTITSTFEYNIIGTRFNYNTIKSASNNIIGNYFQHNTLGTNFNYNDIKNSISYFNVGDYFQYNTIESNCNHINIADSEGNPSKYIKCCTFKKNITYLDVVLVTSSSSSNSLQNYTFKSSLVGTSSNHISIECERKTAYDVVVAKNSNGDVKHYCEADFVL